MSEEEEEEHDPVKQIEDWKKEQLARYWTHWKPWRSRGSIKSTNSCWQSSLASVNEQCANTLGNWMWIYEMN